MMNTRSRNLAAMLAIAILTFSCNSNEEEHDTGHSGKEPEENMVSMTMQQMKAIDLKLGKAEKHNLSTTVKSNGRVDLPPQSKADVSALIGGVVNGILVIEGDHVDKGQTLARLQHPDIVDMQQKYLENVNSLEFLAQDYQRKKELYEKKVGSGKNYQKALSEYNTALSTVSGLKAKLRMLGISIPSLEQGNISPTISIVSPIKGYVRFVKVNIGSHVQPNDEMFEITDNSKTHADLLIYEKDIHKVKKGQEVHFTLPNMPGRELKGRIFSIGKAYRDKARAITVHATIEREGSSLIPGMYVNARIIVDSVTTDVLPEEALASEGDRYFIFVRTEDEDGHDGDGKIWSFRKTEVIPGIRDNGLVEVRFLASLPDDAEIAVNSAYYLLAEMGKGETEHSH